jgi:hypothetical protein
METEMLGATDPKNGTKVMAEVNGEVGCFKGGCCKMAGLAPIGFEHATCVPALLLDRNTRNGIKIQAGYELTKKVAEDAHEYGTFIFPSSRVQVK